MLPVTLIRALTVARSSSATRSIVKASYNGGVILFLTRDGFTSILLASSLFIGSARGDDKDNRGGGMT